MAVAVAFGLTLLAITVVDAASINCRSSGYDLTKIRTTQLEGKQLYNGAQSWYFWDFDLCKSGKGTIVQRERDSFQKEVKRFDILRSLRRSEDSTHVLEFTSSSSSHQFVVQIRCGEEKELDFAPFSEAAVTVVDVDGHLLYSTLLVSSHVCGDPQFPSSGCGGGCLFVVLFFVAVAVYVLGTVLWYYFKEGRRGADLIPHREFWLDFPILLKDGFMFLVNKIRALMGGASHVTYEEM